MIKKTPLNNLIFDNFSDYWYYVRNFSHRQRKLISENLSINEQKKLKDSYNRGGWDEVFFRDSIFKILDQIKDEYDYDVIDIKCKVLSGKSVYVPTIYWLTVKNELGRFQDKHISFAIGGIKAIECEENKEVTLLVRDKEN